MRAHNANSHAGRGWEEFTSQALRAVSKSGRGVVFLAWGTPAQKRIDSIGVDKTKHCVLRTVHPSPLSAARGFFDCQHFLKANEWLRNRYGVEGEVEWDCLAEGKQNKGLPPKEPILSEQAPVSTQVTELVDKDSSGDVTKMNDALGPGRGNEKNADEEFDDPELDRILSS